MNACSELAANAATGVAPALRAVDCLSNDMAAAAFGRLFASGGTLMPALTILLTLYIAFFAVSLLTGRSQLGISALTPRMMTLGLVLTFATSWMAYQSVVWNLAIGAPDQIASVLTGVKGSATQIFADRIDMIFGAIGDVASASGQSGQGAGAGVAAGSFTPANIMWLGALLLLLGTVGVLVTARIALAVLLAVGPVFVVLGLFPGTRGLTAGWLRGVVLTAVTPLFVVVGGGIVMELLVPVVSSLQSDEGQINSRAAMALFLIATVHIALMAMITKVTATTVSGWSVFGLGQRGEARDAMPAPGFVPAASGPGSGATATATAGRVGAIMAQLPGPATGHPGDAPQTAAGSRSSRTIVTQVASVGQPALPQAIRRTRGIGSRFSSQSGKIQGMIR